jgi:peptide-methionine (S)-S-oxide reductase
VRRAFLFAAGLIGVAAAAFVIGRAHPSRGGSDMAHDETPSASARPARSAGAAPGATETAVLGGGCFWCLEAVFDQLEGVRSVVSGYSGGSAADASYKKVCTGTTGHAEVVQVTFDPAVLSYDDLLRVFFTIHDPTTLDRQGADTGPQYRSAIFYGSPEQKAAAERVIAELAAAKVGKDPIVTRLAPLEAFYAAEDYHQEYYARNESAPYCRIVVAPKVAKFRKAFVDRLKK